MGNYTDRDRKSKPKKLRLLSGGNPAKPRLRQLGVAPKDTMLAGTYKAMCEAARIITKWGKSIVECSFRVVEGEHFSTALPGWFDINIINNGVMPGCQYTKVCELILGREIEPDDDIDPEAILVGKVLLVEARFKTTDGKSRSPLDRAVRKGPADFLRVCSVLGAAEL